jgi:hypothetical protein
VNRLQTRLRLLFSFNIIILMVSLPFLGVGLYEVYKVQRMLRTYGHTSGIVTGTSFYVDPNDNSGAYYPNVTFQPEDSRPVSFTDGVGTSPARYRAGDESRLSIIPTIRVKRGSTAGSISGLGPLIFMVVGAVPLLINLLLNLFGLSDRARQPG